MNWSMEIALYSESFTLGSSRIKINLTSAIGFNINMDGLLCRFCDEFWPFYHEKKG